jgi:hypothetical protein
VLPAGSGLLPVIFFPRTDTLSMDEPDILFEAADGMISVSAKFVPRKMVYKGKLAL